MLPDTCYLILFTCYWLPDTFDLELVTGYLLPKTCYIIVLVTLHLLTHIYRSASSSIDPVHLGTPAIYSSFKKCPQNCTVCSSIRTFFRGSKLLTVAVLWTFAKTANRGSSMDTFRSSCAQWPQTMRFLHDIKLQTMAVLWSLFGVVEILSQECSF